MHVPYSMDDREQDLYGGMGGYSDDEYTQTRWESEDRASAYTNVKIEHVECTKFFTQEQMDKVIKHNLSAVMEARTDGYNAGWNDGYDSGHREGNENCQHR